MLLRKVLSAQDLEASGFHAVPAAEAATTNSGSDTEFLSHDTGQPVYDATVTETPLTSYKSSIVYTTAEPEKDRLLRDRSVHADFYDRLLNASMPPQSEQDEYEAALRICLGRIMAHSGKRFFLLGGCC